MPNPFVHVELNTQDVAKAKAFYGALFDWKLQDNSTPGGVGETYTMIGVGETGTGGGIMKHPMPGAGSFWLPYVLVDDIRAATDKARALGAKIVRDVTEIPEYGALAIFEDPVGGVLGLWKPVSVPEAARS